MKLTLERWHLGKEATLGTLFVDDAIACYTLEDLVRELPGTPVAEWKIKNETAIPRGTYKVVETFSSRFQQNMPLLEGVEGFSGIRIHPGNTEHDTSGCILVGKVYLLGNETITHSREAYSALLDLLRTAWDAGEEVFITIL